MCKLCSKLTYCLAQCFIFVPHEDVVRGIEMEHRAKMVNTLSTNATKWSDTLKQFVDKSHFVGLALKVLKVQEQCSVTFNFPSRQLHVQS